MSEIPFRKKPDKIPKSRRNNALRVVEFGCASQSPPPPPTPGALDTEELNSDVFTPMSRESKRNGVSNRGQHNATQRKSLTFMPHVPDRTPRKKKKKRGARALKKERRPVSGNRGGEEEGGRGTGGI